MTNGSSDHPGVEEFDELDDPTGVRALLAAARDDVPMPDQLADRIKAALLTEAGYRATGGVPPHERLPFDDGPPVFDVMLPWGAPAGTSGTDAAGHGGDGELPDNVTPLRRKRSPMVWLGAAAAAVLAVGVGGGLVTQQFTQGSTSSSVEGAALAPDDSQGSSPAPMLGDSTALSESPPDLDPASLPDAVDERIRESSRDTRSAGGASAPDSAGEASSSCAARLGLDPATPSFAATWEGSAAIVYVVQDAQGKHVTVVDAECQAAGGGGFRYDTTVTP